MPYRDATDAVSVMTADHESVSHLFSEYVDLVAARASGDARRHLAGLICDALTAHAVAEEELLYPVAREALEDDHRISQALRDHDTMRTLIRQIQLLDAADARYDALVALLARMAAEHARQEEGDLFPRLAFTSLDLGQLGEAMTRRRAEVLVLLAKIAG